MTVKEPPKIAVIVNPAAHKGTSFRFVSEVETLERDDLSPNRKGIPKRVEK